ncbi:putative membrane protein [Neisseria musculi]|uniref:Membrane protein n=1 Tax=Neisseria musculi TaxID=1815583 RepID=A0A7H1M868_9NEIS|nr:putative membrane protein [Neisseria musculi]
MEEKKIRRGLDSIIIYAILIISFSYIIKYYSIKEPCFTIIMVSGLLVAELIYVVYRKIRMDSNKK